MNEINLGTLKLPINSATKTFAILAKRGAGKTYAAGVVAEEFAKNNIPFVVFDPIDVWWGLRFKSNGKDPALPVVIFGIEHSDIKLERGMGKQIAQAIVKDNISCVISTFGMPKTAQRQLITEFAEELLNINNTPRHIFIEEAHEFVPQRVGLDMGKCFNAVSNLVVMGRNRGIGVTLVNQRAATMNKDVLTQIDTLIALRNVAPQDRAALKDWVEYHAAEGDFEEFMRTLPSLPTGEAWVWSPEFLNYFGRIKIRQRETFHPDREKLGVSFEMPSLSTLDVQSFIEKFNSSKPVEVTKADKFSKPLTITPSVSEELVVLRNKYESELMQRDIELRELRLTLEKLRNILGVQVANVASSSVLSQVSTMWKEKLGTSMEGKIFSFLLEKAPMKFTRPQIGTATGFSYSSGSFSNALSKLKVNGLVIRDGDHWLLNPEL